MNFTYNWQSQPQVAQKGPSTNSVVPTMSRPFNNGPSSNSEETSYSGTFDNGGKYWGKARPLKQWRKRLHPQLNSGGGTSGIGMPSDIPGGSVYLGSETHCSVDCSGTYVLKENLAKNPATMVTDKNCFTCNPETNIIKSGKTYNNNPRQPYYSDTNAYLRSRNRKYTQNLATGYDLKDVTYYDEKGNILPPTNDGKGTQTYYYSNCGHRLGECFDKISNGDVFGAIPRLIYKPSNPNFSTQGAVDSSTRLLRLKVNSVNKSAKNLVGWGEGAKNASTYNGSYSAPYILKSKYAPCVNRRLAGNHTMCFYTAPGAQNPLKVPHSS
jgi:hypothetical protein